jgi:hypoxanthine phosphoribosyltransferase
VRLASYAGTQSTGLVRGLDDADLRNAVRGREVLIVDDILDTGRTLAALVAKLHEHEAAQIRICVLLEKESAREIPVRADWVGFRIADEFVVGYGLDHDGQFRSLKDIHALTPDGSSP